MKLRIRSRNPQGFLRAGKRWGPTPTYFDTAAWPDNAREKWEAALLNEDGKQLFIERLPDDFDPDADDKAPAKPAAAKASK